MNKRNQSPATNHPLVACLVVPGFVVALARRDNPALHGRPIVVGGSPEEHARVTACSREAAEAGVVIGTTLRRALALCPKAVFLPLHESYAVTEASRIVDLLHLYSPVVEAITPGHAHFDLRGLAKLAGQEDEAYLRDLHDSVSETTGLPVQLAAAESVFAAHAAAITFTPVEHRQSHVARPPLLVPPGQLHSFLACLPVEVLPVAPHIHQRLRLFGVETIGQVAALPFTAIQAQFGNDGARAWQLATGHDDSTIVPAREEVRIDESVELPAPTVSSEPLVAATRGLIQRALSKQGLRGQSVRRMDWRGELENGEQVARRFVFREPTTDAVRMLFVARQRIERLQLPAPAIGVALTLSGLCSEYGHQSNLWQIGPRRQRELADAIDQLNVREGGPQVFRIVEVQPWSRIPERQMALVAFGP